MWDRNNAIFLCFVYFAYLFQNATKILQTTGKRVSIFLYIITITTTVHFTINLVHISV